MKVARYDYKSQFRDLDGLLEKMRSMLLHGHYVLGKEVEDFEADLAAYVGAQHAVGVGCGTDSLLLALRAAGIGRGDRVITQANTFHATVSAIIWSGAEPVLVDADEHTFVLDDRALTGVSAAGLRAVLPVHLYGRPCPMESIMDFARARDLLVIEDAAQALGARSRGKRVGGIGDLGCVSFHPSKNLAAAGDGGVVLTNSKEYAESVNVMRSLGQEKQDHHVQVGVNSKLDALQAVVLHAKLPLLNGWNEARRAIARSYRERLADLPVTFQAEDPQDEHVYQLFQLRTPHRDALLEHLRAQGVDAIVRYPFPIHLQPAFADRGWRKGQFPVAERLAREIVAIPIRPNLMEEEVEYVCASVRSFFECRARG
jgi:dTDP-4-amino-4,6-dideoxygalactose transaminase